MNIGKENKYLEFKKSTSLIKESLQSVSAILNKKGKGTLYFGVKNNDDYTAKELIVKLNKTERTINRALAKLKIVGYIRRNGSDKTENG